MRVDIYRRPENAGRFSYLAVPEGKLVPNEATNIDWEAVERGVDLDEDRDRIAYFPIDDPLEQITAKGYAITSIKTLEPDSRPM